MRRRAASPRRLLFAPELTYREVVIALLIDAGRGQQHRASSIKTDEISRQILLLIGFPWH